MTTNQIPYIITNQGVTVVVGGSTKMVSSSHEMYSQVVEHLSLEEWDEAAEAIDIATVVRKAVNHFETDAITFDGGTVKYYGEPLTGALVDKIIAANREGVSPKPLLRFLEKLMLNPSRTAVNELYLFLESGHITIHPDGDFLAYKVVNNDYTDCFTSRIDNSVGKTVEMPRNSVDDQRNNLCSTGLHFCSLDYAKSMFWSSGRRMMIVKINPADVVSIPADYDNTKGRTWRYTVFAEQDTTGWQSRADVTTWNDNHFYEFDEDDDDIESYYDEDDLWDEYDDDEFDLLSDAYDDEADDDDVDYPWQITRT